MDTISNPKKSFLTQIIKDLHLTSYDEDVYIVGGFLRELFLDRYNLYDIDIIVKNVNSFINHLKKYQKTTIVLLDKDFEVYRVFIEKLSYYVDIAKIQNEINDDLSRRDFTINALCYDVKRDAIIDNFDGLSDLKNGVIKKIDDKNMFFDPLRILRAFRFKAELGFIIEDETLNFINSNAVLINNVAKERIKAEIFKILNTDNATKIFRDMYNCGLLQQILPFVSNYEGFNPGKLHQFDLLNHSFKCMEYVENNRYFNIENDIENKELEQNAKVYGVFKLTAFIHDIGKPLAKNETEGKITFYNHDKIGAKEVIKALKEIKFSNESISFISNQIEMHMYLFSLLKLDKMSPKNYIKIKNKLGIYAGYMFNLFLADNLATCEGNKTFQTIEKSKSLYNDFKNYDMTEKKSDSVMINGNDIKLMLSIEEGPVIGRLLGILKEAKLSGSIKNKDDAKRLLKEVYEQRY